MHFNIWPDEIMFIISYGNGKYFKINHTFINTEPFETIRINKQSCTAKQLIQ